MSAVCSKPGVELPQMLHIRCDCELVGCIEMRQQGDCKGYGERSYAPAAATWLHATAPAEKRSRPRWPAALLLLCPAQTTAAAPGCASCRSCGRTCMHARKCLETQSDVSSHLAMLRIQDAQAYLLKRAVLTVMEHHPRCSAEAPMPRLSSHAVPYKLAQRRIATKRGVVIARRIY